jgi:hypothetical protein
MSDEKTWMGTDAPVTLDQLPEVVIADQHGHFWRKYADQFSMCPVSEENIAITTVATYVRSDVESYLRLSLESALALLAKHGIHGGLHHGYCAVCEGQCMLGLTGENPDER